MIATALSFIPMVLQCAAQVLAASTGIVALSTPTVAMQAPNGSSANTIASRHPRVLASVRIMPGTITGADHPRKKPQRSDGEAQRDERPCALAGRPIKFGFQVTTDVNKNTNFFVDSVSLDVIACSP